MTSAGGEHIVLIDDDQDMHEAIKLILEPEGYRVSCYSTGPAGLEAVRRDKPDLLLLDIMLASPSEGFHLAYELKEDAILKELPVVMISAIGQTTGMDYAKELGTEYVRAEGFLEKPLDAQTLRATVKKVLESKE